jgi:acetyltransferase-like isoleucine patch superfamily enzyme
MTVVARVRATGASLVGAPSLVARAVVDERAVGGAPARRGLFW